MVRLSLIILFFFASSAVLFAVNSWNNSAANNGYNDPQNWSNGLVPVPFGTSGTEDVYIALDSPEHAVADSGSGIVGGNNVYIGINGNGRLEISDLTFKTRFIRLGYNSDGTLISNNAVIEQDVAGGAGRYIDIGCSAGAIGYIELNGNTQFVTGISKFGLGIDGGSTGTAIFNDDTVVESLYIHLGDNGVGSLVVNDHATYHVTNAIWLPQGIGTGHLQMNSGTVTAGGLIMRHNGGVGTIDIELGRIMLDGDDTAAVGPYVSNGWITAYGGNDDVDVYYDGTHTIIQAYSNSQNYGISTSPSPSDGFDNMPVNIIFRWKLLQPGTRNFYLGTNYSAVSGANETSPEYRGSTTHNYFITPLAFSTTYYWRVDYVNASGTYESDIWTLSTESPSDFTVEGFESYLTDVDLKDKWQDGLVNGTGASIALETMTGNKTYKGQSLKFNFDNTTSPYKSEIVKNYASGQNWSAGNVEALTLKYLGDFNAEGFYVSLFDGSAWATQRIDDINVIAVQEWHEFNFALDSFVGVNFTNIKAIKFGIANPTVSTGYSGTVYIDEIRLNKIRCVSEFAPAADFDGDCDTDYDDLVELVSAWLRSDYRVVQSDPGPAALVAYYEFESTSGSIVYDSSGNGYNAAVDASGTDSWDINGYNGRCLLFDGTFGVTLPNAVFENVNDEMTISAWVHIDENQASGKYETISAGTGYKPLAQKDYYWHGDSVKLKDVAGYAGRWNHYSFVIGHAGIKIYKNAELVSDFSENINIAHFGTTRIGADNESQVDVFIGKLDEFKVFNKALNQNEIAHLAENSFTQPLVPVISPVDPKPDGIINLMDLSLMANDWTERILWP